MKEGRKEGRKEEEEDGEMEKQSPSSCLLLVESLAQFLLSL
jgi:hypothetical protein